MMKKIILTVLVSIFTVIAHQIYAQKQITIFDALQTNSIRVKMKGSCYQGKCVTMEITNITSRLLALKIEVGTMFPTENAHVQDLIAVETVEIGIPAHSDKQISVYTMCTQSFNCSPTQNDVFSIAPKAQGHLLRLVELIFTKKYFKSAAQSAVWAVTSRLPVAESYTKNDLITAWNGNSVQFGENVAFANASEAVSISDIHDTDVEMIKNIAPIVSEATNTPISSFNFNAQAHYLNFRNVSFEIMTSKTIENASLKAYDSVGNVIRTYFTNEKIVKGFSQRIISVYQTSQNQKNIVLKLESNGKVIQSRILSDKDSVTKLEKLRKTTAVNYQLDAPTRCLLGVYDSADNLYHIFKEEMTLGKGVHQTQYRCNIDLPANRTYFFKIKTLDNKIIASQNLNETVLTYPPKLQRGNFELKIEKKIVGASIIVVDSRGNKIQEVYKNSTFTPNVVHKLKYVFYHTLGDTEKFSLKVLDSAGNVIQEQCIVHCE